LALFDAQTVTCPPGLPWWVTCNPLSPPKTNRTPLLVVAAAAKGVTQAVGICATVGVCVNEMVGVPATT
jgi:hypothetical protein